MEMRCIKPMQADDKGNMNNYIDIGVVRTEEDYKRMEEQYEHITHYNYNSKDIYSTVNASEDTVNTAVNDVTTHQVRKAALPLSEYKYSNSSDLKYLRRTLNHIRNDLSSFENSIYIKTDNDYVSVYRSAVFDEKYIQCKRNYDGYALICRTGHSMSSSTAVTSFELPGVFTDFICACNLTQDGDKDEVISAFKSNNILTGAKCLCHYTSDEKFFHSIASMKIVNNRTVITLDDTIRPNTVIIVKFKLSITARKAIIDIEHALTDIYKLGNTLTLNLSMCDINLMLFKCDKEELDNTNGKRNNYGLKYWGHFVYAGISHIHKIINEVKLYQHNHPLLDNIREGDWLLYYIISRYENQQNIRDLYEQLMKVYRMYNNLYVHFKPVYATKIIDMIYNLVMTRVILRTKTKLVNYSPFMLKLITAIYQFTGYVESSRFKHNTYMEHNELSISAGLPHFSNEYMRCW